jgi:3-deoxy-D-manno-octulosonate 8-phosphate phosphatase (KDO 8-P phosphatase)
VAARRKKAGQGARAAPKRAGPSLRTRLARARLVCLDVDGVLTDGRIILGIGGAEQKAFHAHDGFGIDRASGKGLRFAIVTGRTSEATARRARELGITEVHQGVADKATVVRRVQARHRLRKEELCYIGDDVPDLPVLDLVGLSASPADALPELLKRVDYIALKGGGRGAVREVVDLILRAQRLI